MRSPGRGIDPRVNIGDMSDDPVEYAIGRFKLVQEIMPGIVKKLNPNQILGNLSINLISY